MARERSIVSISSVRVRRSIKPIACSPYRSACLAAHLLHRAQLLEERGAVGLTVGWRVGLAADDEPEFALLEVDGSCAWLRLPSAGTARRGDHHRLAGRTLMQLRCLATVALNLRRVDRTPVDGERPLDMILGSTDKVARYDPGNGQ